MNAIFRPGGDGIKNDFHASEAWDKLQGAKQRGSCALAKPRDLAPTYSQAEPCTWQVYYIFAIIMIIRELQEVIAAIVENADYSGVRNIQRQVDKGHLRRKVTEGILNISLAALGISSQIIARQ